MWSMEIFKPITYKHIPLYSLALIVLPSLVYSLWINHRFWVSAASNELNSIGIIDLGGLFTVVASVILILIQLFSLTIVEIILQDNGSLKEKILNSSVFRVLTSKGHLGADVFYFLIHKILKKFPLLAAVLTFGILHLSNLNKIYFADLYASFARHLFHVDTSKVVISLITVACCALSDYSYYWRHRILHDNKLLWSMHEFHHSATEMTVFSKDRILPAEGLFLDVLLLPSFLLTSAVITRGIEIGIYFPILIVVIHVFINEFSNMLSHSSLYFRYRRPFDLILMNPCCHWLHHSDNPKHFSCNFGVAYSLWDRIHGTYVSESNVKDITGIGDADSVYNRCNPIKALFWIPFVQVTGNFIK